jgi:hypothetical protein
MLYTFNIQHCCNNTADKLQRKLEQCDTDAAPLPKERHTRYMEIVGALQCLVVVTRPEIAFAAAVLASYMSCPTYHLYNCALHVLR